MTKTNEFKVLSLLDTVANKDEIATLTKALQTYETFKELEAQVSAVKAAADEAKALITSKIPELLKNVSPDFAATVITETGELFNVKCQVGAASYHTVASVQKSIEQATQLLKVLQETKTPVVSRQGGVRLTVNKINQTI